MSHEQPEFDVGDRFRLMRASKALVNGIPEPLWLTLPCGAKGTVSELVTIPAAWLAALARDIAGVETDPADWEPLNVYGVTLDTDPLQQLILSDLEEIAAKKIDL